LSENDAEGLLASHGNNRVIPTRPRINA